MGSTANLNGVPFRNGDRVLVTGGYEQFPEWLGGGDGYAGTLIELRGKRATIELDAMIHVGPPRSKDAGWRIVDGSSHLEARIANPEGKWLVLSQGWTGSVWNEPTDRLHVVLCQDRPIFTAGDRFAPPGAWVEGHACLKHLAAS